MKRRVVKPEGDAASSGDGAAQRSRAQQQGQGRPPSKWLKRSVMAAIALIIVAPFSLRFLLELIQHFVYKHRVRLPFFFDLSQPADLSLNHTINMYLTSEEGISLGVWHTVPESQWKEAQGKDLAWYQNTLSDATTVFIYLHGNAGTRGFPPHRVAVAKILSGLGYHVVVPDYRGFGDSTGEPTEAGLSTDALFVINWVKARCGECQLVLWGHSLGTGVGTNIAVKLIEQGVVLDGVILEGTFNIRRGDSPIHPFFWYYWKFPGAGILFPTPWAENKLEFPTEENLKKIKSPILFLHSEDDYITPIEFVRELYEVAVSAQSRERVQMVTFDGSLGYVHNGLYRDPQTPGVLKKFVSSLQRLKKD